MHCSRPEQPPALILSSSLSFFLPPYFLAPAKMAGFFVFLHRFLFRIRHSAVHSPFPSLSVLWFSHILTKTDLKESSGTDSVFFLQISGCTVRQSNESYDISVFNLTITKQRKNLLLKLFSTQILEKLRKVYHLRSINGKNPSLQQLHLLTYRNCTMH